jgi:Undecaprenyl-phosphate glucose phosphotransferase
MPSQGYSKYQKIISLLGDLTLLFVAFYLAYFFRQHEFFIFDKNDYLIILLVYVFTWWILNNQTTLLVLKRGITIDKILYNLLRNASIHIVIVYLAMIILRFYGISRLLLFYAFLLEILLLGIWRVAYFKMIVAYRKRGHNYRNIVLVGNQESVCKILSNLLNQADYGYKVIAILSNSKEKTIANINNFFIDDFKEALLELNPDEVFCSLTHDLENTIPEIIKYCEQNVIRIKLFPNFQRYVKKKVTIDFLNDAPILLLRSEPLESMAARTLKRLFDIAFSLLVIIGFLSWLVPIIALLIRLESKGPIFFAQERTGKGNQNFMMLKFRSMTENKDSDKLQATKGDSRITKMGKLMRKTSIDELPQFFNVFIGEMSVVGPRPHMLQHTKEYSELINQYMVRHFVKPGITGWAQINGFRGPTPEPELMRKRVEHDVWYLENWSFLLDLTIIFRTVTNVIVGENNAV